MSTLRRIGPLGAACAFALGVVVAAVAAPGDLDPAFGVNGRALLSPALESSASAVAVQTDGKLVLAGAADDQAPPPPPPSLVPGGPHSSNADFLAVRLSSNGSLDSTFGSDGVVRTSIDPGGLGASDGARAVAVASDGRIVLAGFTAVPGGTDFAFVRYTPTGSLDPTFSGDGIQTVDVGPIDGASGVAVQSDGKVVAVGSGGLGFTVVRLRTNGQLDASFGNRGVVDTAVRDPSLRDDATAVVIQNGKILVAGTADSASPPRTDFALVRYLSSGRRDPSFGAGGIVATARTGEERAFALAKAPGNKIAVAGRYGYSSYRVARYLANGSLDRTFGGAGIVTAGFPGMAASALGIRAQADGKLVAAGLGLSGNESAFTAARYRVDGRLDSSFSEDGKAVYDLPAVRFFGAGLAVQRGADPAAAGRLVVAGQTFDGSADHVVAVGVDLGPLEPYTAPPPPPPRCRIPRVVGLRLAAARAKIRHASCRVGRIIRVRSSRPKGIVVAQTSAGLVLWHRAKVRLYVSRGRR